MAYRIWGEWIPHIAGSGSSSVRLANVPNKPHIFVYKLMDAAVDEDRLFRDRALMVDELAKFMNGGPRPAWLDDFERTGEDRACSLTGEFIEANSPLVEWFFPDGKFSTWKSDTSEEAKNDRARLMDVLFLT